jgi:hypothetical protein
MQTKILFVYQVMELWLKRRKSLIHDYSLVGYILAPQQKINNDATMRMTESTAYTDAVTRLIGKLFDKPRPECLAELTTLFLKEHRDFCNRSGVFANAVMWTEPDKDERIVSCQWHASWTVNRSKVLGKLACLVLSKPLGIGTVERNWKQVKRLKSGDRSNLSMPITTKITNVYGQYQQMKSRMRENQLSSVGKLWTEDDFHCMKMNMFCEDIAKSLDEDTRMATMRTFHSWNEKWHHPTGGLSSRGDDILHERLKHKFLGIKLIYMDNLFWIHNVVLMKKRGDNKYVLIAINENFE